MHLHERSISAREACLPVGGAHARDQRDGYYVMGLKNTDRTSADQPSGIRVVAKSRASAGAVRVTGGAGTFAHAERKLSKHARRKARRYGR